MEFVLIFLEGILAFISPCVLPMLPVYISYFSGTGVKNNTKNKGFRSLLCSLAFVLGITVVYTLLGLTAGSFGAFLSGYKVYVNVVCGIFIVFFGLCFLDVFKLSFLKGIRTGANINGIFSAFIFGIIFSVSLSPCTGVFLGSALGLAANSASALKGALLLVTYSLGLGLPFIASAILLDKLKGAFSFIKKHYKVINYICGGFLIVVGILMMTGLLDRLLLLARIGLEG